VTQPTTAEKLASAGFTMTQDWESSREPLFRSALIDTDDDPDFGLVAYTAREGEGAGQIAWLETGLGENAELEHGVPFEKTGLCVEGVCPGAPAAARKLGVKSCATYRVEEVSHKCAVPGSPLNIIVEGDVGGAKAERPMAFSKIVKAKLDIKSLAWEISPASGSR
jgi:hypothetical protein